MFYENGSTTVKANNIIFNVKYHEFFIKKICFREIGWISVFRSNINIYKLCIFIFIIIF